MIIGIGTDILEIDRVERLLQRQPRTIDRIFTEAEQARFPKGSPRRLAEFITGRFAAKEAVVKALGIGFGAKAAILDMEILADPTGKPIVYLSSNMKANIPDSEHFFIHLSISHSRQYAVAQVLIEQV